jgi:hypothetical protein
MRVASPASDEGQAVASATERVALNPFVISQIGRTTSSNSPPGTTRRRPAPFRDESELAAMTAAIMDTFPASEFPYLFELTVEHVLQPGYEYGKEFDPGLSVVLDGVATLLDREGR